MKLLSYTTIRHLLFTALLLLLSIPVFYFVLNKVFIHVIDNDLNDQAKEIPLHQNAIQSERDLSLWKTLDNDLEIVPADNPVLHQGPYTERRNNPNNSEKDDYRILDKKIKILNKDYIVRIKASMIEKEDLVQTILLIQLGLLFLLLLGVSVLNYFLNKRLWNPFYQNLANLQNYKIDNPVLAEVPISNIKEFEQLKNSIHQLTVSVHHAYILQKEFTENASHELQTPLALLKTKLELFLQDSNLSRSQSILVDEMNSVIVQLEQLNINLLFLSKIENNQFASSDDVHVAEIVMEVAKDLRFMADAKKLHIQIQHPMQKWQVRANKYLFKAMVTNLFRNAIQYSASTTSIKIEITTQHFSIQNKGLSFGLDQAKLFQRFSKMSYQKGTGLGLAIAKKIADLSHLHLEYTYIDGWHSFQING